MQPIDIGLHTEGDGGEMFRAVCKLGLEGIVSKWINAPSALAHPNAGSKLKIRRQRRRCGLSTGHFDYGCRTMRL